MLNLNSLKNIFRKFRYNYFESKFKKPNFDLDKNFSSCHDLRSKGIFIKNDFHQISLESKVLIDFYNENFNSEKINSIIQSRINEIKKNNLSEKQLKRNYKVTITEYFKKDDLLNYANQKYLIDNITQYFGFKPFIRNINVQLDFFNPNFDLNTSTQIFHRDYDDIKLAKAFFYLTDVIDESYGPFEFIQKSHLKPWHLNYSDPIKNNEHLLNSQFLKTCIGNQGTLVIADTNGYHRGHKLNKNYRVLVYVMYTSNNPFNGKLKDIFS
jgi:hypothetical protein